MLLNTHMPSPTLDPLMVSANHFIVKVITSCMFLYWITCELVQQLRVYTSDVHQKVCISPAAPNKFVIYSHFSGV